MYTRLHERHVERHCDEQSTHRGSQRANERERERREIYKSERKRERGLEEEEVGPRSLLRSNMLSPHEVFSPPLPGSLTLRDLTEPFSRSAGYVPPLHRGTPSHLINVLIAVNDSEISLTRPKMENKRERGHDWQEKGSRGRGENEMERDVV